MPIFTETKTTTFSAEQLYDLILDVEQYPDFLPWCSNAKIITRNESCFYARLTIGYKMFNESYLSKVTFKKNQYIEAQYIEGPFKNLHNRWVFHNTTDGSKVDFYLNFEFNNFLFNTITKSIYHQLTNVMIKSFITRAEDIYNEKNY